MLKRLFGSAKQVESPAFPENKTAKGNGAAPDKAAGRAISTITPHAENTGSKSPYSARIAAIRVGINESASRVATKNDITKAISNSKLASVFFQKNDFLENGVSAQGYVMDFVTCAADIVTDAESLEGEEFPADKFFGALLDAYRRVPKLCLECLWLLLNVEAFLDRAPHWPAEKRALLRLRALEGSMGKGILSANHLIKSEILKARDGSGRLHEGPLFKELNTLFREKGEAYNERLRLALRMSWAFAYAEMAKAGIPEKYRLNLDTADDVTSILKIIIADTAMERHPYGPNKRRQTLSPAERAQEVVKYAGRGLMFHKGSVVEWLKTRDRLSSLDLVYLPTENSIIEKEGLDEYSLTLFDLAVTVFPSMSEVNASLFAEALKKLLVAHFSVKKKFTMKLAPAADGGVSIKTLDYDGETVIRDLTIPAGVAAVAKNELAVAKPAPQQQRAPQAPAVPAAPAPLAAPSRPVGQAPANTVQEARPAPKKRLDLDLG